MLPIRYAVTFASGYVAYWDARDERKALRYARPWVKLLGEVARCVVHPSGPRLSRATGACEAAG